MRHQSVRSCSSGRRTQDNTAESHLNQRSDRPPHEPRADGNQMGSALFSGAEQAMH